MDPTDIAALIRAKATENGVDPDILTRIATVESNLNPNAQAGSSSAKGLFQFTNGTWQQHGNGADPLDPAANADAGARFTAGNQKLLASAGIDPTPGNTYLAHFAGPGGALKVLKADPSAPVGDVLGPAVVKANPFLANMKVSDLQAWADKKMGGATPTAMASSATQPMQVASAAPTPGSTPASAPLSPMAPGSDPNEPALTPELMAQLQNIPKLLAQQSQPTTPVAPLQRVDPSALARMRIVQRAIAGQPIIG